MKVAFYFINIVLSASTVQFLKNVFLRFEVHFKFTVNAMNCIHKGRFMAVNVVCFCCSRSRV